MIRQPSKVDSVFSAIPSLRVRSLANHALFLSFLYICGGASLLNGQQTGGEFPASTERKTVRAVRINSPVQLDGVLDEAGWQGAEPASEFVQAEPYEGDAATEDTEVWVLYDNDNLYIGVYCHDSEPNGILVNSLKEDFFPNEADSFEVILDTLGNQRNGFLFTTNPRGAKRDVQVIDQGRAVNADWDAVWDVRAEVNGDGWTAEMVIPFRSLSLEEDREQVWGIKFPGAFGGRMKSRIGLRFRAGTPSRDCPWQGDCSAWRALSEAGT